MKEEFKVIGKRTPQYDSVDKVMGKTKYTDDLNVGKTYVGKVLRSELSHAKIISIDTEEAKKIPGVKGVFTGADVPDNKFGPMVKDWEILAKDKVRFIGDEVAAVIAVDEETADLALEKIKVEYEELPGVYDPEEAFDVDAPQIHDKERNAASTFELERGDVDAAYEEADYIFEDVFFADTLYHSYLETQRGIAVPEEGGRVTLYLSIQVPSMAKLRYAEALNVDPDKIRIIKPQVGGGFGAKFEYKSHIIAAFAAMKLGVPVKIINTREEDFIASNPRVPMRIYLKLAFKKDGTLTAKETKIYAGNGARTVYGPAITSTACYRIDSMYRLENVRTVGHTVYTNTVPTSCYRGFGNSQTHFAFEQAMDVAANELGIDPGEIRLKNTVRAGDVSVHGWEINSCGIPECVDIVKKESDFSNKREEYKNQSKEDTKQRGIGLAICNHVSGNRPFYPPFEGSAAIMKISPGGKVTIHSPEAELGQGMNTVFAQLAAEVLGLPLEDVRTEIVDTDVGPFGCGSFASRVTTLGGNAVLDAARKAKEQILDYASKYTEVPKSVMEIEGRKIIDKNNSREIISFAEVCEKAFYEQGAVPITIHGKYIPDTVIPDENKYGNVSVAYPFGCHVAEVEVDTETGKVRILNYWAAHDVGRALNPLALEGQIEGGVANAMGWTLSEKLRMSEGKIQNPNFLDYKVPTSADVNYHINTYLIETNEPNGPLGAKGIGEPAKNPGAPAIANAIHNAVGFRLKEIPFLPQQLYYEINDEAKTKSC